MRILSRHNLLFVLTVIIGVSAFVRSYLFGYSIGYFRDMNPDVEMDFVLVVEWVTLAISFVLTISNLIIWLLAKQIAKQRKSFIVIVHLVIIVAVFGLFIGCEQTFGEAYKDRAPFAKYHTDTDSYFVGISMDELTDLFGDLSGHESVIYIARNDCAECTAFEEEILNSLKENSYLLPTYYTNNDRDGARSEEMYDLLEKYKVNSVPSVLVVKNNKVLQLWSDPLKQISQIKALISAYEKEIENPSQ